MAISAKHYLGTLCKRGHQAPEDPTKSLRFKTSKGCVGCSRIQQQPDYIRLKRAALKTKEEQLARHRENVANWRNANKEYFKKYNNRPDQLEKSKLRSQARHKQDKADPVKVQLHKTQRIARYHRDLNVSRSKQSKYRRRPEVRLKANRAKKDWLLRNPQALLRKRLRNRVGVAFQYYSLTGKQRTAREYGIDYKAIIDHLGPCPGSRKDWHVDHIIPLCHFNLEDPAQIKLAFLPENHQWLPRHENIKKGTTERRLAIARESICVPKNSGSVA